jgi:hypothetical protein
VATPAPGDRLQLVARGSGPVPVAQLQEDLHVGGQQRGPPERPLGLGERSAKGRRGAVGLALGQAKECESRLWLGARLARGPVRRLGRGVLTSQSVDLGLPVHGRARRPGARALREPGLGPLRFAERLGPLAAALQDLGA